ncbi:hypothetical protein [Vibrio owensii]|uniref:hypothetical protein n=1 Tax=Vibrio owensii TaxID=696485 RepID=UPI003CC61CDC
MSESNEFYKIFEVLRTNEDKIIEFNDKLHDNIFELLSANQKHISDYREKIAEHLQGNTKTIASFMSAEWDTLDKHESNEKVLTMFKSHLSGCASIEETAYKALTFSFKVPMYVSNAKHTEQAIGMIQLCVERAMADVLA